MPPCGGDGQQGGLTTSPAAISRLLQQSLLGAKKVGWPESGYEPKASKSLHKEEVQDGDYEVYLENIVSRRLGDIHRPERLIFSRAGTSRFSEVPQGSGKRQGVSTVWTVTNPEGVLSGHRCPGHPSPQTHHLSPSVLGRLAPQRHIKSHLYGTHPDSSREGPKPGLPSELGQAGTRSNSEVCLPRRGL